MTKVQKAKSFIIAVVSVIATVYIAITYAQPNVGLSFNTAQAILSTSGTGVVTGSTYAMPGGAVNALTWQITHNGSAINIALQASLNGTNWYQVDVSTNASGEIRNYGFNAFKFIRAAQTSRTGGTSTVVTVTAARGFTGTSATLAGTTTYNGNLLFTPTNTYTIGNASNTPLEMFIGAGSRIKSSADGIITLTNVAGTSFTRLNLGGDTSSFPGIRRNGAQVLFQLADGSANADIIGNNIQTGASGAFLGGTTFAALGTPIDGNMRYCNDCTFANPCASGGTGAIAKRLNGAWRCD